MARVKRFIDKDVLTAARERIHHIYDLHDAVAVCFSGGKDSLAALHLTWDVAQERGLERLDLIFRDEELIPDEVIAFVDEYRVKPWVRMLYFAVPLASTKFILGRCFDYVQWDPKREHIRPVPPHAIVLPAGDERVFDQYTMDEFAGSYFKGKVAFITGIRAAESIMRFRASVNKLNDNYINASSSKRVSFCKPLYDWQENDIFKFFMERQIRYCSLYDAQHLAGDNLRVSTPLHAESAKRLGQHRAVSPEFYRKLMRLFPEMHVQERYWSDLDRGALRRQYGQSLEGVRAYIDEQITDEQQQAKAAKMLDHIRIRSAKAPELYPPDYVLNYIVTGSFKRELLPKARSR